MAEASPCHRSRSSSVSRDLLCSERPHHKVPPGVRELEYPSHFLPIIKFTRHAGVSGPGAEMPRMATIIPPRPFPISGYVDRQVHLYSRPRFLVGVLRRRNVELECKVHLGSSPVAFHVNGLSPIYPGKFIPDAWVLDVVWHKIVIVIARRIAELDHTVLSAYGISNKQIPPNLSHNPCIKYAIVQPTTPEIQTSGVAIRTTGRWSGTCWQGQSSSKPSRSGQLPCGCNPAFHCPAWDAAVQTLTIGARVWHNAGIIPDLETLSKVFLLLGIQPWRQLWRRFWIAPSVAAAPHIFEPLQKLVP